MISFSLKENYDVEEVDYNSISSQLSKIKDIKIHINDSNKYYILRDLKDKTKFMGIIIMDESPRKYYNIFEKSKEELGHNIELLDYWVDPKFRNMGIGKTLMLNVLNRYKGNKIGLCTGRQTTNQAKYIYSKFGFKILVNKDPYLFWIKEN